MMQFKKQVWIGLALAALASPSAMAQQRDRVEPADADFTVAQQGDWELQLGAGGSNDNDFESGDFNLDGAVGYYFDDHWMGSIRQEIGWSDIGDDDVFNGSTNLAFDYHFGENAFRPFLGANIGYLYGDNVDDTFSAGPEGGVKWYVKDEAFLFGRVQYQFLFEDSDEAEENIDDGRFVYTVGIGLNF